MRMSNWFDGTTVPHQLPRRLAWGGHMALHDAIKSDFNSPVRNAFTPQRRLFFLLGKPSRFIMDADLDFTEHSDSTSRCLEPLGGACSVDCAEASACTHTGRRYSLYSCLETLPGSHFSHSALCQANIVSQIPPGSLCARAPFQAFPHCLRADRKSVV